MAKTCPNCGKKNKNIAKFCENCGTDINNVKSENGGLIGWWDSQSTNNKYGIVTVSFCTILIIISFSLIGLSRSYDTTAPYSQTVTAGSNTAQNDNFVTMDP